MKAPIAIGVLAVGLCATAHAQQNQGAGWEFGAELLYQDSTDLSFNGGSRASLDDDLGFAITFGYRFNSHLGLSFGLDWNSIDYEVDVQSGLVPGVRFTGNSDLDIFTTRASLNYNFLEGNVRPYITAGIGYTWVDTNIPNGPVQTGCWWDPWWGYVCAPYQSTKTVDDFSYQAGAGVRWDFGDAYTLRFGYEKQWFDYSKATSTPDFDQLRLGFSYRY